MPASRDIRMLMRYNAWANARLYAALAEVPESIIEASRPGRTAGMMGTLAHIHVVDLIWQANLEGRQHGFKTRNLDHPPPLPELRTAQTSLDHWYIRYTDTEHESRLDEVVDFHFVDGSAGSLSRADMLLHVVNHKTYHRGYVADMLYESGLRPPTMDLPVFLRDEWPALRGEI